jgi:hypothetical protein
LSTFYEVGFGIGSGIKRILSTFYEAGVENGSGIKRTLSTFCKVELDIEKTL